VRYKGAGSTSLTWSCSRQARDLAEIEVEISPREALGFVSWVHLGHISGTSRLYLAGPREEIDLGFGEEEEEEEEAWGADDVAAMGGDDDDDDDADDDDDDDDGEEEMDDGDDD